MMINFVEPMERRHGVTTERFQCSFKPERISLGFGEIEEVECMRMRVHARSRIDTPVEFVL